MLAILHLLVMFIADWFKPRRQVEVENLFLRHQLNIALRCAPHRLRLRGGDRALLVWMCRLGQACSGQPGSFSLTRYCGGIEPAFAPIGAGNPAVLSENFIRLGSRIVD
jgi:hypothetical protein